MMPPRKLTPPPKDAQWGHDLFHFDARTKGVFHGADTATHTTFADLWHRFTLGTGALQIREEKKGFGFRIATGLKAALPPLPGLAGDEAYRLCVDATGAACRAIDLPTLRHAWMTWLQLLNAYDLTPGREMFAVPEVDIRDRPALTFRGIHFCVFPETSLFTLERMLRWAGLLKYTHVIVEFWGTLKMDTMPLLGWPEAHGKERIRLLFDSARAMGLEVVPMFNIWGHATGSRNIWGRHVVLDQDPTKTLLFEPDGWTWCLSNPDTALLHSRIMEELCELAGPGGYFHIGCDEAYSHATCDRCRREDAVRLFANYVNAFAEKVASAGRRPIMWGDALLAEADWAQPTIATSRPDQGTHRALAELDRRIVIADWQYNVMKPPVPTLAHFASQGFDVLPSAWYEPDNIRTLGQAAAVEKHFGFLQTTWQSLNRHIEMIPAGACAGWVGDNGPIYPPPHYEGHASWPQWATHLRALMPSGGDYTQSGWNAFEQ